MSRDSPDEGIGEARYAAEKFLGGDGFPTVRAAGTAPVAVSPPPGAGNHGNNLLGIAYAKASEMADTLRDSGNAGRPPMVGEFGWRGGMIAQTKTGFAIAAFSGGKDPDDLEVSRTGLEVLRSSL